VAEAGGPTLRKGKVKNRHTSNTKGWGTLKFHFNSKPKGKATANHLRENCRSGTIALEARSIVRNTEAKGRATRR
jgi:hypothetical protein